MRLKSQQYWAIILTLLFHVVLFWALFVLEVQKTAPDTYEIALEEDKSPEKVEIEEDADKSLEELAERQLNKMLTSKASKKILKNEKLKQLKFTDDTKELQAQFYQQKLQTRAIQRDRNKPEVVLNRKINSPKDSEEIQKKQTVFYVGDSRVEYFLAERYRVNLSVPVYKCEGAGSVEITVLVNREGQVVSAEVCKKRSKTASSCMKEAALQAALTSLFSKERKAPIRQKGRIVYSFSAQ